MITRFPRRSLHLLLALWAAGLVIALLAPPSMGQGHSDGGGRQPIAASVPATTPTAVPADTSSTTTTTTVATTTTSTSTTSTSTTTTSTTLPLFTAQKPLRVLAVGDSLMTYPGYAIADLMDAYAGLRVESVTKQSSGLVRRDYYDWPKVLGQTVRRFRPHIVVVLLGANDQQPILHQGHSAALFTEAWNAEYAKRIDEFILIATGAGAGVVWVGLPIMRDPKFSKVEEQLNALYAAGCEARPGAFYIDGYSLFADETGRYAARLVDSSGESRLMRAKDGIHFTMDGARRIADEVLRVLSRNYRLEPVPSPPSSTAPDEAGRSTSGAGSD